MYNELCWFSKWNAQRSPTHKYCAVIISVLELASNFRANAPEARARTNSVLYIDYRAFTVDSNAPFIAMLHHTPYRTPDVICTYICTLYVHSYLRIETRRLFGPTWGVHHVHIIVRLPQYRVALVHFWVENIMSCDIFMYGGDNYYTLYIVNKISYIYINI